MGHKGVNCERARGDAQLAASQLFERANLFFHEVPGDAVQCNPFEVETPDGAAIERVEDWLTIRADFLNGSSNPYTVTVAYGEDIRELPEVQIEQEGRTRTVPIGKFPTILGDVLALVP